MTSKKYGFMFLVTKLLLFVDKEIIGDYRINRDGIKNIFHNI